MLSVVDLCRTSPFDNDEQFIYIFMCSVVSNWTENNITSLILHFYSPFQQRHHCDDDTRSMRPRRPRMIIFPMRNLSQSWGCMMACSRTSSSGLLLMPTHFNRCLRWRSLLTFPFLHRIDRDITLIFISRYEVMSSDISRLCRERER